MTDLSPSIKNFEGRNLVIASSHGKEVILAPLLCDWLKVNLIIDTAFNSNQLREKQVDREVTPLRALRTKLVRALEISTESLGIGTEAFFITHPKYPWIVIHTETAMLVDLKQETEAVYSIISLQSNYHASSVSSIKELIDFAERVHFPSHGVCFRSEGGTFHAINDFGSLIQYAFQHGLPNKSLHVETDIRVSHNPTRRRVVRLCVEQLMKAISAGAGTYSSGHGFICSCGTFKNLEKADGSDLFCIGCEALN